MCHHGFFPLRQLILSKPRIGELFCRTAYASDRAGANWRYPCGESGVPGLWKDADPETPDDLAPLVIVGLGEVSAAGSQVKRVILLEVPDTSEAAKAGFFAGDVLLAFSGNPSRN